MSKNSMPRWLALLLAVVMLFGMAPIAVGATSGGGAETSVPASQPGAGSITIASIEDREARIIVNDADVAHSVNWGSEPLVIMLNAETERGKDDYSVTKAPDTSRNYISYIVEAHPRSMLDVNVGGLFGDVLTLTPQGIAGTVEVTVTAIDDVTGDIDVTAFNVNVNRYVDTGEYEWGDMELPGSGFVSGLLFHPHFPNRLYARTDVGGAYRFNFETNRWECMTFWASNVGGTNRAFNSGGVSALAVDPNMPDRIFMMSQNVLYGSEDRGTSWTFMSSANVGMVGANGAGRGIGERLAVVSPAENTSFAELEVWAGGSSGLRRSLNGGGSWETIQLRPRQGVRNINNNETQIGFISIDPLNPDFMIVSTGGQHGQPANTGRIRGASIYYTERRSATNAEFGYTGNEPNDITAVFKPLPFQPATPIPEEDWSSLAASGNPIFGYTGFRADFSIHEVDEVTGERYFFVSFTDPGVPWGNDGFHMEGGSGMDGAVFRYSINGDGKLMPERGKNVSPRRVESINIRAINNPVGGAENGTAFRQHGTAIASMSVCKTVPGALIVSTHNTDMTDVNNPLYYQRNYDVIYRSVDYGATWFPVLGGYDLYGAVGDENGRFAYAPHLSPWSNATKNIGGANPHFPNQNFDFYNPSKHGADAAWFEAWPSFNHWNGSSVINPFNPNHLVMNSGNGTFATWNLTARDEVGKIHGEPHLASQYADSEHAWDPTGELRGFFRQRGWHPELHDNVPRELLDYTPDKNIESRFPHFRINGGNGTTTRANSVAWDGIRGLNMTVAKDGVLNSPPTGDYILLAGQGDKSGSKFHSIHEPCENTIGHIFSPDPRAIGGGNLPIIKHAGSNSTSQDYSDHDPMVMVAGVRGEWHENVFGAVQISFDGGRQWHNLPDGWVGTDAEPGGIPRATLTRPEYQTLGIGAQWTGRFIGGTDWEGENAPGSIGAINNALALAIRQLKADGVRDPGWVVLSADSGIILWQVGPGQPTGGEPGLPAMQIQRVARTDDFGQTWHRTFFWEDSAGTVAAGNDVPVKIFADRANPNVFYAFENSQTRVFISNDKGLNFHRVNIIGDLVTADTTNWANNTFGLSAMYFNALRGQEGRLLVGGNNRGSFWLTANGLDGDPSGFAMRADRICPAGVPGADHLSTTRIGYGLGIDADSANPVLYKHGRINAVIGDTQTGTGIFRSVDGGVTWRKISMTTSDPDALHMDNHAYQDVRAINGDSRTFGRVYFSTGNGSGAIRWGEMITNQITNAAELVSKIELDKMIEYAESYLDNAKNTISLQEAIDAASALIIDEAASQAQIDAMINALEEAVYLSSYILITGTGRKQLEDALAEGNVILATPSNFGISSGNTLIVPQGSILRVTTALNIRHDAELVIEGTLVVAESGRINNDGSSNSGGGTITIREGGKLENYGYVENVSGSSIYNFGAIENNGRFEVRARTKLIDGGKLIANKPFNIHKDAIYFTIFSSTGAAALNALLADRDVILTTPGNYGITSGNSLVIPAERTLIVTTTLNVRRDANLVIEGTLIVLEGARLNNDGSSAGGGTITIGASGRLENSGHVENVSNSFVYNYGTIVNNGRFEVRVRATFINEGEIIANSPLNIHSGAIIIKPEPPETEPPETEPEP